jgi:hypothetical protein
MFVADNRLTITEMLKIGRLFWLTDFYVFAGNQIVSRHGF